MTRSAFRFFQERKTKKQVKLLRFHSGRDGFKKAEESLTRLVNDGWTIITAAAGVEMGSGFVILQRNDAAEDLEGNTR